MSLSRRKLLAVLGIGVGVFGVTALSTGMRDWLVTQLADGFGQTIAFHPETSTFLDDYLVYLEKTRSREYTMASVYFRVKPNYLSVLDREVSLRQNLFAVFLRATNVVRAIEARESLHYAGIFDPEIYPCSNQLGAQAL